MLLSVILPVYNSEKFLEQSIKSVLGQKFQDWELIAINDGSTDNSLKILKKYKVQDKLCRIKIVDLDSNKGLGYARNKGIGVATGKFLFFLDSDDFIEKNCFSILSKKLKKKVHIIGYNGCNSEGNLLFKTIPKKRKDGEFESDLEYAFLFRKGRFSFPWIYVIDRKFFLKKRIKFLEGTYFEDHFFNIQLLYYCHRVRIIPHALYNYRLHDLSITGNATPQKILDIYDVYEKIKLFLINKNIFKLYKELFYARYLTYCVYRSFERYWSITDKEKKIRIYLKKVQSSSLLEDNNLKSLKKITLSIPNNENIKRDYLEAYYNLKLIKKHYFWFNIFSFFKIKIWYKLKNGSNRF